MEKELAGSNSSLSSSYRQWAAVRANLLPIWEETAHIESLTDESKKIVLDWLDVYQNSTALAVDEIVFNVFISQKYSNPGVFTGLDGSFIQIGKQIWKFRASDSLPLKILPFLLAIPQRHSGTQSREATGYEVTINSEVFVE